MGDDSIQPGVGSGTEYHVHGLSPTHGFAVIMSGPCRHGTRQKTEETVNPIGET